MSKLEEPDRQKFKPVSVMLFFIGKLNCPKRNKWPANFRLALLIIYLVKLLFTYHLLVDDCSKVDSKLVYNFKASTLEVSRLSLGPVVMEQNYDI